jgi:hypothetical protein
VHVKLFAFAGLLAILLVVPARAGLYSPDEPFIFEIDSSGFATPIQFAGGFDIMIVGKREVGRLPRTPDEPPNPDRKAYLDRVALRQKKGVNALSQDELAGYTADLIRLNRSGEALNILQPLARDPRRGGFLAYAHLAVAHAASAGWTEANEQEQMAVRYSEFPTAFARLTKSQLAWLKRVEREYYYPFLAHRAEDSRRKRSRELNEDVDPIFPSAVPPKKADDPFRVAAEQAEYKAGTISDTERKKLPKDAMAIVQQLVLWHPHDARLYWLLGELYNADGDVDSALKILDHCSFNMGYSNPTLLKHRQVLQQASAAQASQRAAELERDRQAAAEEKQREEDDTRKAEEAERDYRKRFWWILSIGVALALMLVYYQFREVIRRVRRRGGLK